MKLNKIMKVVVALLLIALLLAAFTQIASATNDYDPMNPNSPITSYTTTRDNSGASTTAQKVISRLINIAQVIGMGVAILMLIVLAIKYISASPEGKAEIKKNATIYIVGAVVLFAASGILQIIRRFAVGVNEDATAGANNKG